MLNLIADLNVRKLFLHEDVYDQVNILKTIDQGQDHDQQQQLLPISSKITVQMTSSFHSQQLCIIGPDVMNDIEMVKTYLGEEYVSGTVFNVMDMRKTKGSLGHMHALLTQPSHCYDLLIKRQQMLMKLEKQMTPEVDHILSLISKSEADISWLFDASDEELSSLYDMVYFNTWFLKFLNKQDFALTGYNTYRICISPLIGFISPITYFVIPYLVLRFKFKVKMGFISYLKFIFRSFIAGLGAAGNDIFSFSPALSKIRYISYGLSLLFYFQNIFNNIEIAKVLYKISSFLTQKVNGIVSFLQQSHLLIHKLWTDDINTLFWNDTEIQNITCLESFIHHQLDNFNLLSNYGKQLRIFKSLNKSDYIPVLKRVYMLDCIISILRVKARDNLTYVRFIKDSKNPVVSLKGFHHPCIPKSKAISNDMHIGDTHPNNIVVTGPNAGGKSTLIKSVLLSALLAQSITVGFAEECSMTPFYLINSQINIPDCKGKESLFEAEMNRSKASIDMLRESSPRFSLLVMDEIFNSTNPVEGIAGAFAIAKNIASYQSNIMMITTHYLYLTKLKKECPGLFENFKMNVDQDKTNQISYPYKLAKGVSKQYIALELLKQNGFDSDIISDAIEIKERLVSKPPSEVTVQNKGECV